MIRELTTEEVRSFDIPEDIKTEIIKLSEDCGCAMEIEVDKDNNQILLDGVPVIDVPS